MTEVARKIRLLMELRREGITDTRVLSAIERVPREQFIPDTFQDRAYDNAALPIGHGQTISQPLVVATMTQALEIGPRMRVLEVGTGCGYQTAVLCGLARRVYTIELVKELQAEAEKRLLAIRVTNFTAITGDGAKGWPDQAPFDRIIVTAAPKRVPHMLIDQLADDGIMVIPIGEALDDQWLECITKREGRVERKRMMPVRFVPLISAAV
ncbi:MAG TPA: protein-L-isoaspartate(D-aspartate) O-methyltransferase [Magnetospirillaceae bacterium]